jgi:hypothetical protein
MRLFCTFLLFISFSTLIINAQTCSPKRGIAYGHLSEADLKAISGGLSWWYNWYISPEDGVKNVYENYNMDYVPMAWGESFNETALRAFLDTHKNVKYILGFNEPNFKAQSNMSPTKVASLWPKIEAIAADYNLQIVGPAVNWCGECVSENGVTYSDPYQYLDDFFNACPTCKVDYIAVHNYMCYTGALTGFLDKFKKYGKKIWLTEFACWDQPTITVDMQKNLLLGALDYLDNDTMIYRYAWFTGDRSGAAPYIDLFKPAPGELSDLGKIYVNYYSSHDTTKFTAIPSRIEAESYTKMSGVALETTADEDGFIDVGWIDAGDWLTYNVDVPADGKYYVYLRVAANAATSIQLKENETTLSSVAISYTGGWQSWKTFRSEIQLTKGQHTLKLLAPTGNFNLNWITFTSSPNVAPTVEMCPTDTITQPINSYIFRAKALDADNDKLLYKWEKKSGLGIPKYPNGVNVDTLVVTGLTSGKYVYALTVSDGIDAVQGEAVLYVDKTTGIEQNKTSTITVYPNPVGDKLTISSVEKETSLMLIDQSGKVLYSAFYKNAQTLVELDFSHFVKGCYILQLKNKNGSLLFSVVK